MVIRICTLCNKKNKVRTPGIADDLNPAHLLTVFLPLSYFEKRSWLSADHAIAYTFLYSQLTCINQLFAHETDDMGIKCIFPGALILCVNVASIVLSSEHEAGALPTLSQLPFLTVWNAPTAQCKSRYGVDLDLGVFNIVSNQNQSFMGDNITIFYNTKLGLYPRYNQGEAVNGGVPQNSSLLEHLRATSEDLRTYMPDRDFQGLAVVDWESWRPLWERNWEGMKVYWEGSRALVRSKHPDWSPAQVEVVARKEFEDAARAFMEGTLRLGEQERPKGMWGFYGFPSCYNYYKNTTYNYTGECPQIELKRNDDLFWLWNVSSALYPDIYLDLGMRGLGNGILLYTHHRVMEAMRVGAQVTPMVPPVFPYARIVYTYSLEFLSQAGTPLFSMLFCTANPYCLSVQ
ncbi:unnamed protein product [Oncorhynchus mykiss]|uniref:Hyaluronidase n=1 Tax=Oncorhynchus mykiss TaxID=8022 RepID=A0A060XI01_ONCMY|nr:unnamed protein product [Oncorhynchus mykiss]